MALSNTAVPKYYGRFRDAVIRGEIPVNREVSLQIIFPLCNLLQNSRQDGWHQEGGLVYVSFYNIR